MTPAIKALQKAKAEFQVHEYEHNPAAGGYGMEAAKALGLDPACVYKTLLARLDGKTLVVAIVPVTALLDLKQLARAAGAKRAEMADPAQAERSTGYVLGGISPFGQRKPLKTILDSSALSLQRINVSGGRRGLEISLTPQTLRDVLQASVAQIARID